MAVGRQIGEDVARTRAVFERRPSVARSTRSATARLVGDGWRTEVQLGGHTLIVDQPAAVGGGDNGPNPGDLVRAALAACLTQNYAMHAARFGVALAAVEVEVESEINLGMAWGVETGEPAGFQTVRYITRITTETPEERVRALVDYVEGHSPSLDDLRRALPITGRLEVSLPQSQPTA